MGVRVNERGYGRTLYLRSFGAQGFSFLEGLAAAVAAAFGLEAEPGGPLRLPLLARSHYRRQYRASSLLRTLAREHKRRPALCLGLTDRDLYAPHLSFVFGKANVGAGVAVVSLARLAPGVKDPHSTRMRQRLYKVAVHEVGHLAGLGHCADPACVMCFAGDVAALKQRRAALCANCAAAFEGARGPGRVQAKSELYLSSGSKGTPVAAMLASPPSSRSTRA